MYLEQKRILAWSFFDFANSSYALLIQSLLFSVYFREVIAQNSPNADLLWGISVAASILIGGILSPFLGAIADFSGKRKKFFVGFTLAAIGGTALLYFLNAGMIYEAMILFITTNICYLVAILFYDSFLVSIISKEKRGSVSGLGWGLGYLGGILAIGLFYPLFSAGYEVNPELYRLTFPSVALFFLVFSLPSFIYLKESKGRGDNYFKRGYQRVFLTLKRWRSYKNVFLFLLAYYFIEDGLTTVFNFTSIFAKVTLQMPIKEIVIVFLVIQIIAFPATIWFGKLADRYSNKKILMTTILGWCLITIMLAALTTKTVFYAVAIATSFVIGSSQATARALFSKIIPRTKASEFFGFNSFATKISSTFGPLLFGVISTTTGSQRYALLSIVLFFVVGFALILFVKET
ncbi:MAG: MFS transporter [Candidatus Woesearchaeota archaeon]